MRSQELAADARYAYQQCMLLKPRPPNFTGRVACLSSTFYWFSHYNQKGGMYWVNYMSTRNGKQK